MTNAIKTEQDARQVKYMITNGAAILQRSNYATWGDAQQCAVEHATKLGHPVKLLARELRCGEAADEQSFTAMPSANRLS